MDRALADCKRGFLDGLRTGRMGVAGAGQILGGTAKLHQDGRFVDHFARLAADNVHAKHPIRFRICENLHESLGGLVDLGAPIGGEGEFADGIGYPRLFQLLFSLADSRHFRRGIHHARDNVVIHMPRLAGEDFRNRDAFVLGLMGQHRTRHDVTDGIYALHAGGEMRVDLHAAAIVEHDTGFLQAETLGVGNAADRDQHHVGLQLFRLATRGRFDLGDQRFARCVDGGDLGTQFEGKALLLENALKLFCHFAVIARQDAIEKFHHRDLRTEPVPHRAELKPDHAGADDQKPFGHPVKRKCAGRRHDALLVDFDALERRYVGAGGDDDVFGLDRLRLAVIAGDLDLAGTEYLSLAADDVDLVLLHQELDALDVAVDALPLEFHHRGKIELWSGDADAHFRKRMRGLLEHFRRIEQRLRGHAADIETGAAERRILLDHGDLHTELRRADRADISARTGADDNKIVSGHDWSPVAVAEDCDRY